VSLEDPLVPQVEALRTGLYVEYNGMPLFHGPCLDPSMKGSEGVMEIPAVDAGEWLERAQALDKKEYSGPQEYLPILAIRDRLRSEDFSALGAWLCRIVDDPDTDNTVNRAYTLEEGNSFWALISDLKGLSGGLEFSLDPLPPDQTYLLVSGGPPVLDCFAWARLRAGQVITATGETTLPIGVPEPSRREILLPSGIVPLNIYPTADIIRGDDTPVPFGIPEFEFGFGQSNTQDMSFTPGGSQVKNIFTAKGQPPEAGDPFTSTQVDNASVAEYGSWSGYESTNFTNPDAVAAVAQQQVAAYKQPPNNFSIVPAMEWMVERDGQKFGTPPMFMKEYGPGNMVSAEGQFGRIRQRVIGRVTQATVTEVDAHGNVKVDLTCVPRVLA
jgi:hypothetical protein